MALLSPILFMAVQTYSPKSDLVTELMISSLWSELNWWREESMVDGLQVEEALLRVWLVTTRVQQFQFHFICG